MSNTEISKPAASEALFVKMVLDAWNFYHKRTDETLDAISDEQMMNETAPGRNTGIYLLGHLVGVNDNLFPLLGFGDRMYPELQKPFISNPDKSGIEMPPVTELRKYWKAVNEKLNQHINALQPADWFAKHTSVTAEDFAKEPHRNRLNVIISRTNHLNYHLGQLNYLKPKK